ncbi:MAG: hypothetical protein EOP09_08145, partial [Proteobacteria bacterium]
KDAIVTADLKLIQEKTHAKEYLVECIRSLDQKRALAVGEIFFALDSDTKTPTLSQLIMDIESSHSEQSLKLRAQLNTLLHLVKSAQKFNNQNKDLLAQSIQHIEAMKKNVLGESKPKSETYGAQAQVKSGQTGAKLVSKEV